MQIQRFQPPAADTPPWLRAQGLLFMGLFTTNNHVYIYIFIYIYIYLFIYIYICIYKGLVSIYCGGRLPNNTTTPCHWFIYLSAMNCRLNVVHNVSCAHRFCGVAEWPDAWNSSRHLPFGRLKWLYENPGVSLQHDPWTVNCRTVYIQWSGGFFGSSHFESGCW